ncbi:MAG: phospho-sugar mutase [Bacteroidota bacterium]|nr:phospho-sugar mutase [Bacteroidota bacterium]
MAERTILQKAQIWLNEKYDPETRQAVSEMIENDPKELSDSFYKNLSFGTGGMRGIMGVGTNRINKYTMGSATQGFSNYLKKAFRSQKEISVVITHDNRNNSRYFAEVCADVFSANSIKVYLFDDLRPTPELSFAVRELNCQGGVMLTASHNPKEYNGYKAYWDDGAQVTPPHDTNITEEVNAVKIVEDINFDRKAELIQSIGKAIDEKYINRLKSLSLSPEIIKKQADFKIVYTPLHGTGVKAVPEALKAFGFSQIYNVPEQDKTDGNFPTVVSPNPENAEALTMALKKAEETNADMVAATDPDADRVGIAVRDLNNEFVLLNGNQTASVLIYYLLKRHADKKLLKGNEYIVKTVVTTELLADIANHFDVEYFDTLTGFKYIAEVIRKYEGKKKFIGGGEESYGYLAGEFVRDKDAVMSTALIAEAAAWAKENGSSFYELLVEIYAQFGFYKEALVNLVKKGQAGENEIKQMMTDFRENPPQQISGSRLVTIKDFLTSEKKSMVDGTTTAIDLPPSNVIQFFTEDGAKITVRPSGTEPKIKFYIGVKADLCCKENFESVNSELESKIEKITSDLNL